MVRISKPATAGFSTTTAPGEWLLLLLLFLLPIKFGGLFLISGGTPAVTAEWIFFPWPVVIAMGWGLIAVGLMWRQWQPVRDLWAWLPLVWLATQWLSVLASPWPERAALTALYFSATVVFFYWAWWPDGEERRFWRLLMTLLLSMVVVCAVALQQHFGGFQQTIEEAQKLAAQFPALYQERLPAMIGKLQQGRVFGTLYYPNSLAGFLILLGPLLCWGLWRFFRDRLEADPAVVRVISAAAAVGLATILLFCLLLTKSKGGFLMLTLALAGGLLLCQPLRVSWRIGILVGVMAIGGAYFGTRSFQRGIETLEARGDYWRAGLEMIGERPWLGGGAGTFGLRYVQHHQEGKEWTRLAHNNFLQMWTDSGLAGFVVYAFFWLGLLWRGAIRLRQGVFDWRLWAIWVGLSGWVGHNMVDFDLYIAAVAWPAFLMAGWLVRQIAHRASR